MHAYPIGKKNKNKGSFCGKTDRWIFPNLKLFLGAKGYGMNTRRVYYLSSFQPSFIGERNLLQIVQNQKNRLYIGFKII